MGLLGGEGDGRGEGGIKQRRGERPSMENRGKLREETRRRRDDE